MYLACFGIGTAFCNDLFVGSYVLRATVSSCCCPATWGPALLWPLQLRQQAVYARTVYKDPRYA